MHLSLLVLSLTLIVPEFFHSHPLDIWFQYLIDFSYRKTICIPVPKCNYFGRRPKHLISNDVFFTIVFSQPSCVLQSYSCSIYFTIYSKPSLNLQRNCSIVLSLKFLYLTNICTIFCPSNKHVVTNF